MPKPQEQKLPIKHTSNAPITNDPRFASVHSDPRFALPRRKDTKVTIDKRFKHILKDEDYLNTAKVDKYGRRLETGAGKKKIKEYYNLEGSEEESSEEEDETLVKYDPARGEGIIDTSDESETDEEAEVEDGVEEEEGEGEAIPTGDIYRRFAVVNLDWDNVRAVDLMAALSSFKPEDGKVLSVRIYPSEFGKERLQREEMEGPPRELFTAKDDEGEEEEINEKTIIKTDDGEEFDSTKLRNYQLERLRYYYAVVECDSAATAKNIYDECDGAEYEASANFFDLRFVSDDISFEDDDPKDECTEIPAGYTPTEFVTDALQHSKVKLTWDQDDAARKNKTKKAFSQREIEEMDLKEYLASSDSEDEGDAEELKNKYRALLNLGGKIGGKEKGEVTGDMEITFTSGLMGDNKDDKKPDHEETTIETYKRKEKERMKARKEAYKAKKDGLDTNGEEADEGKDSAEEGEDLGFDDPFFQDEEPTVTKKDKKKQDKEAKKKEAAEKAAQRAELQLLMMDDEDETAIAGGNMKHFNMREVVKAEKEKKLKKRKRGGKKAADAEGVQDGFEADVKDPRFAAIFSEHEFAIDPTNPRFKQTSTMKKFMEEKRSRSKNKVENVEDEASRKKRKAQPGESDDVQRLVQSLKRKSKK